MSEVDEVRAAAGLPENAEATSRADDALAEALVAVVQRYLGQVSDHWDVDLFFETYGRPPRDGSSWSGAIIDGLVFRKDISDGDRRDLINECKQKAVDFLIRDS